ncbi:MAG TPA: metallophosphoesterase family protein [Acidobacteriota bacterium]|nr:metallophosphoesterase family protein [Acidobacteriota bacterium]
MKVNARTKTLILVFVIALLPRFSCLAPVNTGATATPDHVALTWTGDPATTMTITWRTDPTVTSGVVQYQKGGRLSKKAQQAKAVSRDFVTDLGATRLFTCTLANLSPNAEYAYRVGDGEHWSDQTSFSTAPRKARTSKFLIFADSQSSVGGDDPYGIWRKTLHNAYSAHPDAEFFVNIGDLVDYGQMEAHWNAWFAAAKGVIDRIPAMVVSGNHEYFGSQDMTRSPYFDAQWVLPQNGPEGLKGRAYSYDYGPVHCVVLDSQAEEQKSHMDILAIQKPWLDADLAASKAKWKIVFFHKPPYTIYPGRNNSAVKAAFCPIMEKHGVDLVFNAHDHGIARTYPIKGDVLMKKPSEGVIYYVSGQSGGKSYKAVKKMAYDTMFHDSVEQPNYLIVDANENLITVKTILQDGTVLDEFFIDKKKDLSSDMLRQSQPAG